MSQPAVHNQSSDMGWNITSSRETLRNLQHIHDHWSAFPVGVLLLNALPGNFCQSLRMGEQRGETQNSRPLPRHAVALQRPVQGWLTALRTGLTGVPRPCWLLLLCLVTWRNYSKLIHIHIKKKWGSGGPLKSGFICLLSRVTESFSSSLHTSLNKWHHRKITVYL